MKRLTTDKLDGNFETTMLNFVYGKDGWAHIRSDGVNDDVTLTSWAALQCILHGCDDWLPEEMSHEKIDETICDCIMDYPKCPVALAYCFATQACHLRDQLKRYEDILFAEDGKELVSLDELREVAKEKMDNPPLTLEELREMDVEPVWLSPGDCWVLVIQNPITSLFTFSDGSQCVAENWIANVGNAYRRKPEEGDK